VYAVRRTGRARPARARAPSRSHEGCRGSTASAAVVATHHRLRPRPRAPPQYTRKPQPTGNTRQFRQHATQQHSDVLYTPPHNTRLSQQTTSKTPLPAKSSPGVDTRLSEPIIRHSHRPRSSPPRISYSTRQSASATNDTKIPATAAIPSPPNEPVAASLLVIPPCCQGVRCCASVAAAPAPRRDQASRNSTEADGLLGPRPQTPATKHMSTACL